MEYPKDPKDLLVYLDKKKTQSETAQTCKKEYEVRTVLNNYTSRLSKNSVERLYFMLQDLDRQYKYGDDSFRKFAENHALEVLKSSDVDSALIECIHAVLAKPQNGFRL